MVELTSQTCRLPQTHAVLHNHSINPFTGCPYGSSPTTQSVAQTLNAGTGVVPAGDCLWFNNKLVLTPSICDAVNASGVPLVISATAQTVCTAAAPPRQVGFIALPWMRLAHSRGGLRGWQPG